MMVDEPDTSIPSLLLINPSPGFRRIHRHSNDVGVRVKLLVHYQLKHVEMRRQGRVKAQAYGAHLVGGSAGVRQYDPLLRGRVAQDITELVTLGGDVVPAAEEEAVATVQQIDAPLIGQEGAGGVDRRAASPRETCEVDRCFEKPLVVEGAAVEEAGQGLGELLAVVRVVDEAQPVVGDALEAAERFGRDAREDLHEEVVGEPLGRRAAGRSRGRRPAQTEMEERSGDR